MASSASSSLSNRAAAAAEAPWPPFMEERYQRLEKLGEGVFGQVYKAWDRDGKQIVAVKQLSGAGGGRFVHTGVIEFGREVMFLKACRGHPSIVELRATHADHRSSDGDSFIVMEYAGAMNLRAYMASRGRAGRQLDEAEVRRVMRQLLAGVARSHDAGILHRDIKPENVVVDDGTKDERDRNPLLEKQGGATIADDEKQQPAAPAPREITCKICDFGMSEPAKQKEAEYSPLATSTAYRAPELLLGSGDYDGRIDTWALGCVMAELLVAGAGGGGGAAFFRGETDRDVLTDVLGVVGAAGIKEWPGLVGAAAMRDPATARWVRGCPDAGRLREVFPRKVLSKAGFEVLRGLLDSNPERRLTAADALNMQWFTAAERRRRGYGACFMSCVTD